jgi:hypothetical protein
MITEPQRTSAKGEAMVAQYKSIQEIFGPHPDWKQGQFLDIENMEPIDILRLWAGKELVIPSRQITAHLLNQRNAGFLKAICPWVLTDEIKFRHQQREINLVVFSPVAEGAPFNTLTSKTGTYTDTTKKRKLGITIAAGVYKDKLFGRDEFDFYMTGLTQCASFTVMLEECFALIIVAFTNACRKTSGYEEIDYSKLLNLAGDLFGAFPFNPQMIWNRITTIQNQQIPELDTVIVPPNVLLLLKEFGGGPNVIQQEVIFPKNIGQDPGVLKGFIDGPKSLTTVNGINFFELQAFSSNSDSKRKIQPLQTRVVVGRFFQSNPNCKATDEPCLKANANDVMIYQMNQTCGSESRVSFITALENCWLFDPKTRQTSRHFKKFLQEMNRDLFESGEKPMKWQLLQTHYGGPINVNSDEAFDYDTPIPGSYENKKTSKDKKGWRDFGFFSYNPDAPSLSGPNGPKTGRYFEPIHVGDMNLDALPNDWIYKAARALNKKLSKTKDGKYGFNLDSFAKEIKEYFSLIDQSPWSDSYVEGLYIANTPRLITNGGNIQFGKQENRESRQAIYGPILANDWMPNIHGGMDLPLDTGNNLPRYPPGFSNAPGLRTIAAQLNSQTNAYNPIAEQASHLVKQGEIIVEHLQKTLRKSKIVDGKYTPPWIMPEDPLQTLLDHILPQKKPIFFGSYPIVANNEKKLKAEAFLVPVDPNRAKFKTFDESPNREKLKVIFQQDIFTQKDIEEIKEYFKTGGLKVPSSLIGKNLWYLILLGFDQPLINIIMILQKIVKYQELMTKLFGDITVSKEGIDKLLSEKKVELINIINRNRLILEGFSKLPNPTTAIEKFLESTVVLKPEFKKGSSTLLILDDLEETSQNIYGKISDTPYKDQFALTEGKKTGVEDLKKGVTKNPVIGNRYYSDFGENIEGYIRTPLTVSASLFDYLSQKQSVNPVILPGEPPSYNFPTETLDDLQKLEKNNFPNNTKLSSFPIGLAFGMKSNPNTKLPEIKKKNIGEDQGIFTEKKKQQKDYSQTVGSMFKSGVSSMPLGDKTRPDPSLYVPLDQMKKKPTDTDYSNDYMRSFPGPWESRMKYYDKISSNGEALMFLSIALSDFNLDTFVNLAKIGQKLFRIELVRTKEEHEMSTVIVMKMGSDTMFMVFGRTIVIPSIDGISGAITVSAEFHLGYVRSNPKNIDWLPYCVPHSFIGGQNNNFITTPAEFWQPNTTGGPSLLAVPSPISQTKLCSPISFVNDEFYNAPNNLDTDPVHMKYSSAPFMASIFGEKTIQKEIAKVKTTTSYFNQNWQHSFVLFQGCIRYPNHKGIFDIITPGCGPKGYVQMNTGDAYRAWNGDGKFSTYVADKMVY